MQTGSHSDSKPETVRQTVSHRQTDNETDSEPQTDSETDRLTSSRDIPIGNPDTG